MSSISWLRLSRKLGHRQSAQSLLQQRRNFLSQAFQLEQEWDDRLKSSPVFERIEMAKFFHEVERKFVREKRGNSVDVDVFANAASAEEEVIQLEELLFQFRRSPQTSTMLPSTTFASLRAMAGQDRDEALLHILDDPLNYGVFPDDYSLVFLLDRFVKAEKWMYASKVASYMMRQEIEGEVKVASEMGLYALFKYATAEEQEPWLSPISAEEEAQEGEEDDDDEVKERVEYLLHEFNDEQFDLEAKDDLVGKAMARLALKTPGVEKAVSESLQLYGWTLFRKWDKVQEILADEKSIISKEIVDKVEAILNESEAEEKEELLQKLSEVKTNGVNIAEIEESLKKLVEDSVKANETAYIENQKKAFQRWNERRNVELEAQYQKYLRETRKEEMARRRKELSLQEEKLMFFDKKEEYDDRIEEKELEWRKKLPRTNWSKVRWVPKQKADENLTADDWFASHPKRAHMKKENWEGKLRPEKPTF